MYKESSCSSCTVSVNEKINVVNDFCEEKAADPDLLSLASQPDPT
jgi:hypothetical protein